MVSELEYSEQYLHLGEKIDLDAHVVCVYRIKTDLPMKTAAAAIATEQSTGTWTGLSTLEEDIFRAYSGKVVDIHDDICEIAYPIEDFSLDIGGVPQILSVIAGNLFGLDVLKGVRLEDCIFPRSMVKEFKGPKFGIEGMRSILKRPEKPLVGTIVKPKIGLTPKGYGDYIYESGMGGLTNGKDDETLVNQRFCPLEESQPSPRRSTGSGPRPGIASCTPSTSPPMGTRSWRSRSERSSSGPRRSWWTCSPLASLPSR
jgi:ribulose-bisphosphate carboxylase large chain